MKWISNFLLGEILQSNACDYDWGGINLWAAPLTSISQWFPYVCQSSFYLLQVCAVASVAPTQTTAQLLPNFVKPTTGASHKVLTLALNRRKEEQRRCEHGALWRVWNHFNRFKTLSHGEVSHSIRYCSVLALSPPLWQRLLIATSNLPNLRGFFSAGHLSHTVPDAGKWYPVMIFGSASEAGLSGAQSQHLNGTPCSCVNNSGGHSFLSPPPFSFTH